MAIPTDRASDATSLVGVSPDVMAEAEHTFGNLFHRLHFCAQKLQARGVEDAATLEETIAKLEDTLRLVLDYTCPLAVDFQPVRAAAVLGSAATAMGCPPPPLPTELADCRLTVDPSRLSDAFRLLGGCFGERQGRCIETVIETHPGVTNTTRWLRLCSLEGNPSTGGRRSITGRDLIAWAVAQKLVEAQGGTLSTPSTQSRVEWTLSLPLAQDKSE